LHRVVSFLFRKAPDRKIEETSNIERHAVEFANNANTANFEVRLYEKGEPANNKRFDIVFGANSAITATDTSGVQGSGGIGFFTEDFCNAAAHST
jgi:hypothetical protein